MSRARGGRARRPRGANLADTLTVYLAEFKLKLSSTKVIMASVPSVAPPARAAPAALRLGPWQGRAGPGGTAGVPGPPAARTHGRPSHGRHIVSLAIDVLPRRRSGCPASAAAAPTCRSMRRPGPRPGRNGSLSPHVES